MAATKAENQLGHHFFDLSVAQCIGRILHGRRFRPLGSLPVIYQSGSVQLPPRLAYQTIFWNKREHLEKKFLLPKDQLFQPIK
jgi:hypothetical protein